MARCLSVDPRIWRRIRGELLIHGKIELRDNFIVPRGGDSTLGKSLAASEAGTKAAKTRWANHKKNNGKSHAKAMPHIKSYQVIEEKESKEEPPVGGHPSKPIKRKTQVPEDWVPNAGGVQFAKDRGFSEPQINNMAQHFVNHHGSKGSLFINLDAAWRTWVLNQVKFGGAVSVAKSRNGFAQLYEEYLVGKK